MEFNQRIPNESLKQLAVKEEPRFLSLLLRDKDLLVDAISYGVKEGDDGHFWTKDARLVYWVLASYYKKYNSLLTRTGLDSVVETLSLGKKKLQEEDKTAVRVQWDKLLQTSVSKEDYNMLKDHINARYVQWKAYEFYKKSLQEIVTSNTNQVQLVKDAKSEFLKIEGMEPDNYTSTMSMVEGLEKVKEFIDGKRDGDGESNSILTYIKSIDKVYNGFERGSYTVVAGLVNGGKTTLMMNIAFNMAKNGYHVVYVSLEKKNILFFTRLLSLHASVDYNRIKRGGTEENGLPDYFYNKLMEAKEDLQLRIKPNLDCIQMPQQTTLSKIMSEVNKVHEENPVDVLIVDYLGVIKNETNTVGRADLDDAYTSQRLQAYGKVKNFVTITGSQLKTNSSKEIRGKAKKSDTEDIVVEVNPEDMSGSKMIIADADNGIGAVLNGDSPPTKMIWYGMKARDDESRVQGVLDFDGRLCKVCDPHFEAGQITKIDQIVYDPDSTVESLGRDDSFGDRIFEEAKLSFDIEGDVLEVSAEEDVEDVVESDKSQGSINTKGSGEKVIEEMNDDPDDIFGGMF